jgi:hypothetical protein
MRRHRSGILALWLLGAQGSLVSGARAEDVSASPPAVAESSDTVEARDAFRLGSSLAKQGQWLDALAAFQRSAHLKPHPITTFNVAYCERALGHSARAYQQFAAALEPASTPDAPALPSDLVVEAQGYLAEAERRVARVNVTLPAPGLTIRVDGLPVSPMAGAKPTIFVVAANDGASAVRLPGTFELWLDAGAHVFILTIADGTNLVESRTLEAGASAAMKFVPAHPALSAAPAARRSEAASVQRRGPNHTPALIAFGVGAAGFVASAIFGGLALSEKSALASDPRCKDKQCPSESSYRDRETRMVRFADFATVGVSVGAVGAAVGAYSWVTAKPEDDGSRVKASNGIEAWIGVGVGGVRGRF